MPYKTYNRKRFMKNRSKFSMKFRPLNMKQKRQVKSIVKRVNPPELKYNVGNFGPQGVSNVPAIYELVEWPDQGTAGYTSDQLLDNTTGAQRIGNMIYVKNIQWRFTITLGDTINYIRVILFQFMDTTTLVTPIPGDVICDPTNNGFLQPINPLNRQKLRILYDKLFHLQSGGLETITKKINIKPLVKNIKFIGNTTAGYGADIIKGKLYYLLVSDSGVIPHPAWINTHRLCFTDA